LFDWFRFGFAAFFVGGHAVFVVGLILEGLRGKRAKAALARCKETGKGGSKVSVIVPARNEEKRIGPLLQSLRVQDYPEAEYVFIDDRSEDGTSLLLADFAASMPEGKVRVVTLDYNPGPNYKQYALKRGIAAAGGAYLLFTDADCVVSPSWISTMTTRLEEKGTGLVIGPVFKRINGRNFFSRYQAFDHAVRFVYLAAATGLGVPCGGFGNNLIFRKEALASIGGYEAVPYSVTEDAALISFVRTRSSFRIRAALEADARVITDPVENTRDFVSQCLRWNNGGLFAPDIATRIGFGILMVTIALGVLGLPACAFLPSLWPLPVAIFIAMLSNAFIARRIAGETLSGPYLRYLPDLMFMPIFFSFLTVIGYAGMEVRWKGAKLG
jgi:cellulose synthase/poly-beta-1,6-N-acetylglucosamine synthase-like glycosyltransferase